MPALDQNEFDRWATDDRAFKARVLDYMDSQSVINKETEHRMTKLEAGQDECTREATKRSAWVSTVISAVVSGLVGGAWGSSR